MPTRYDVLVVGAGCAGAAAAYFLTQEGARVLVLEAEPLPRYKACGGALPRAAERLLPFPLDEVIEDRVRQVTYLYRGREVSVPLPGEPVGMVMRDRLDAHILAQSHADVWDGAAVEAVEETPTGITARIHGGRKAHGAFLVGADGANSVVRRNCFPEFRPRMSGALEAEVPPGKGMEGWRSKALLILNPVPWAYAWVFPKREHLSVGIGAFRLGRRALRQQLREQMEGLGLQAGSVKGHPLPLYTATPRLHTPRTLLLGDAAALVDPFFGEGMRYAIWSARVAARGIITGRVAQYTRTIRQVMDREMAAARFLAHIFYRWTGACFRMGVVDPLATQAFSELLDGTRTYPGVMRQLLRCLLDSLR